MKQSQGFTLIELLIVIAIISLLATTLLPSLSGARAKGDDARRKVTLKSLQSQIALQTDTGVAGYSNIFSTNGDTKAKLDELVSQTGVAGSDYDARSDATSYAVVFPLKANPSKYWCIDASGVSKEVSGRLASSGTPSCGNINIPPVVVSCPAAIPIGHVWYDGNGLTDGEVNQNGTGSIPTGLRMYLVDTTTGLVDKVTFVNPSTGEFMFSTSINSGTYYLRLSVINGIVGSPPPAAYLYSPKIFTGEYSGTGPGSDGIPNGTLNMGGCSDNNFGIQDTGGGDIVVG